MMVVAIPLAWTAAIRLQARVFLKKICIAAKTPSDIDAML
jgi:hypothetical protein